MQMKLRLESARIIIWNRKIKDQAFDLIFYFRAGTGLFARKIPCLRKVAVKPFGLALASLVSSAKFASSHFVHESNFANPLLGFSTCSQYKINGPQKGSIYFRAGKGSRTLDIDLGKVALYQLSYSRMGSLNLVKLGGL